MDFVIRHYPIDFRSKNSKGKKVNQINGKASNTAFQPPLAVK